MAVSKQFAQSPVEDANFDAIIEPLPRQGKSSTWGGGQRPTSYIFLSFNEKLNGTLPTDP